MTEQTNRYFPDLKPGSLFSHYSHGSPMRQYRILGALSKGEIKNTFIAEQTLPADSNKGKLYALKVFKHASELTAQTAIENLESLHGRMEEQYIQEINTLDSADKGRYVASMVDTGLVSIDNVQLLYIAEELVYGPNLRQFMQLMTERKGRFRGKKHRDTRRALVTEFCDDAIRIATKASRGLFYLHNMVKAAHGDLKPDNILIGLNQDKNKDKSKDKILVKVTDFTASRALSDTGYKQGGSILYRPPELLTGEPMATKEGDVWALGVVIYEALTGEYPFRTSIPDWSNLDVVQRERQEEELHRNIAERKLASLHEKNPRNIARNSTIDNLVSRMLSKDPEKRPDIDNVYLSLQKVRRSIGDKGFDPDTPGKFLTEILQEWSGKYSIRFTPDI